MKKLKYLICGVYYFIRIELKFKNVMMSILKVLYFLDRG